MKIKMLVLAVFAAAVAGPATGQMMDGGMMHDQPGAMMQGGSCPMCQMTGGGMMQGDCMNMLGPLGLDAKTIESLQDAHFELKKTAVRKGSDLKILQMELQRLVGNQNFDLDAARKKVRAMADLQAELHAAHLGFLHQLAGKLSSDQWRTFQEQKQQMMMDKMGGRSGGMHSAPAKDGSGKDNKKGGGMMQGGGMMHREGMQ